MTDTKRLSDELAVCAFVPPEALADLAPKFRTIINNRPDSEEPGQPSSKEIESEARRLGIDYVHIPVALGEINDEQVAAFGKVLAQQKGPVLAFCKTGRRAATLWALSQAKSHSPDEILSAAAAAGYDLAALRPKLRQIASAA